MSAGIDRLSNLVNSLPGARQRQAETDYTVRLEETIRTQQSTIDRLTEQRDRLLAMLKENVTMFEAYVDGMNCFGAKELIAEIEAGK